MAIFIKINNAFQHLILLVHFYMVLKKFPLKITKKLLLNKWFLIKTFLTLVLMHFFHFPKPFKPETFCLFGIWLYLVCSAWKGWIIWMVSVWDIGCLFFTSPLYFENCQSSADSVFSNPCHGFCNQRKKFIFRCHGWMCNFSPESLHSSQEHTQRRANLVSSFRPWY